MASQGIPVRIWLENLSADCHMGDKGRAIFTCWLSFSI
jgi:hypothetical protein